MERLFLLIASLSGGLSVVLGAFGAHTLKQRVDPQLLAFFEVGVRYQMYHALALFAIVTAMRRWSGSKMLTTAGWSFVAGMGLFSGSLYLLCITGVRWLGAVTPLGGVAFIIGWLCLTVAAWQA